jgi:molecular chaperone GrpE
METTKKHKQTNGGDEPLEIYQLKEELRQKNDLYLRALADFDNYRKRVERDQAEAARAGKREIALTLLETLDSFDRALEHVRDDPVSIVDGVRAIHRRLMRQLEAQGITQFASRGEPFDPNLHEAVASIESDQYESGTVVDELQRGYRWGDKVLRPARVRVAR